mmetsp:Transcript_10601/g.19215  ORF Transcript_10601/g.19215 Transcript_10601/m.19215 type:complete len:221 (-) Transcript_10601:203-865(-)
MLMPYIHQTLPFRMGEVTTCAAGSLVPLTRPAKGAQHGSDPLKHAVTLALLPWIGFREWQRGANRPQQPVNPTQAACVSQLAVMDVADGLFHDLSLLVKLEAVRLRRRLHYDAGGLDGAHQFAAVGALGPPGEPNTARLVGTGPEVVEVRLEVGKSGQQVEARERPEELLLAEGAHHGACELKVVREPGLHRGRVNSRRREELLGLGDEVVGRNGKALHC